MGHKACSSGSEAADKVKDKTLQDETDAGKQSDKPEEELTNYHGKYSSWRTNTEKVSPPHDSSSKDRILETSTISPQSTNPSCECIAGA